MEYDNINHRSYINLISVMINIARKSTTNSNITDFEKCTVIDRLMEKYSTDINITSICVKFIKQVSKTYSKYAKYFVIIIIYYLFILK